MLKQAGEQFSQIWTERSLGHRVGGQNHQHTGIDEQRRLVLVEPDQMLVIAVGDLQKTLSVVPDHDSATSPCLGAMV